MASNSLLLTAAAAAVALSTVAALLLFLSPRRRHQTPAPPQPDPSLLTEQLSRSSAFFGPAGQSLVECTRVCVVGLGGVGSHAAHLLARTGVAQLTLIDFDLVTLSSLNRHALATRADVGQFKVDVMARHLRSINPHCAVSTKREILSATNAVSLLQNHDYVLDCIDNLETKVDLLEAAQALGIPVVSSLGAGGKADPTRLRIGTLADTTVDPLAFRLRYRINKTKRQVDFDRITVVYSTEDPPVKLLPKPADVAPDEEIGALPNFRSRVMPVLGTTPALFGVAMASWVLTRASRALAYEPLPVADISRSMAHKFALKLSVREERTWGHGVDRLSDLEVVHLFSMFKRRCVVTGIRMAAPTAPAFALARWDPNRPVDLDNCLLVTLPVCEAIYRHHAKKTGSKPGLEAFEGLDVTLDMWRGVEAEIAKVVHSRGPL